MNQPIEILSNPPIVEAVLDIDCDMPPRFDLASVEKDTKDGFRSEYPKFRLQLLDEHTVEHSGMEPPKIIIRRHLQSLQCLHDDEKQLVQVRAQGFSFNRLAPYSSLDDYIAEIRRTWEIFKKITSPVQIRALRLRYINRLLLPVGVGEAELTDYFAVSPRLPEEDRLVLTGFLHQHSARETATGHQATIVLTSQPAADGKFPVIFDIVVTAASPIEVDSWDRVLAQVASLRDLKNRIFKNTLTKKCLTLFQAP